MRPRTFSARSFAVPHPRLDESVRASVPWKPVIIIGISVIASICITAFVAEHNGPLQCLKRPDSEKQSDGSKKPDADMWQMLLVANLLIFFVAMVLHGAPPEITLFFSGSIAVLTGALQPDQLFKGSANDAVVTLALLFPIMKALGDTGIPEKFIGQIMGNPKTLRPAIFRMFIAVAMLSGLFNNTPIVVMMIPLLLTFCQRLNLDHRAMLMPLSYAAQAGGSLTLMGTSINFVALSVFGKAKPEGYNIGFFTLTLGGVAILILDIAFCCLMGPIMLATPKETERAAHAGAEVLTGGTSSTEDSRCSRTVAEVRSALGKRNLFSVAIITQDESPLNGTPVKECGIHRIKGVELLLRVSRQVIAAPDSEPCSSVEMSPVHRKSAEDLEQRIQSRSQTRAPPVSAAAFPGLDSPGTSQLDDDYEVVAEGWGAVQDYILQRGDAIQVAATAEGIATLRHVRGLELANEATELAYLGGYRRHRQLCEAAAAPDLVGSAVNASEWKKEMKCAVVGIRSASQAMLCRMSYHGYTIQMGDVLLLEAFNEMVGSDEWLEKFSIVRKVPNSTPPRIGRVADVLRAIFTGVGLLIMIVLAMRGNKKLSLSVMGVIFLSSLLVVKALTLKEAYNEINGSVLLTIVGALAFGTSMEETRLANCMASMIVSVTRPLGVMAIRVGIYVATVGIGQFLNSAANVAIMGAIAIPISNEMKIPVGEMAMVVTYAASACYMAPYGYQTNTLVIKDGGYTWGDFIRFGGMLQLAHLVLVVCMAPICNQFSPVGAPPS